MVIDGLKAYVQLASGLTDVTRERALAAARTLVAQGEAGVGAVLPDAMRVQVASVTDDLIATSKANRDLLVGLVRAEVERSVSRMGLVSAAELNAATRRAESLGDRVHELERALRSARSAPPRGSRRRRSRRRDRAQEVDGEEVDGQEVDGQEVDGQEVDGQEVHGQEVDGQEVDGEEVDGEEVDGEEVDGEEVDGEASHGKKSATRTSG